MSSGITMLHPEKQAFTAISEEEARFMCTYNSQANTRGQSRRRDLQLTISWVLLHPRPDTTV